MVSRRNYLTITSMMLVVCFLFMLPQYFKDTANSYGENPFLASGTLSGEGDIWRQPQILSPSEWERSDGHVLYVGSVEDDIGYAVTSWASFTKIALDIFGTLPDVDSYGEKLPQMLILEGNYWDSGSEVLSLMEWNEKGVTIVFASLPPAAQIRTSAALRELLGIRSVERDVTELTAIQVFSGFLLGGERIYKVEAEQERELMDLNMSAPWFRLTAATEVYIMGDVSEDVFPEQPYRNEQLPALLWRRSLNGANVFAVNGDYLKGNTGIGVLSAITAKDRPYYLYPVVNSQVMTVANFPGMADENTQEITSRYGKGQTALHRDLLWPSLEAMSLNNDFTMSCFFMPQYNYSDGEEPDPGLITYYLKLMSEQGAEVGVSLQHAPDIMLSDKWERDSEYLSQEAAGYQYAAAFLTEDELNEVSEHLDIFKELRSVCASLPERNGLFFFLNERILCQTVTHDLLDYSFSKDLELNGLQTALGYSNVMLDLKRVSWPEEGEPGWEEYYETYASNLHTYWKRYDKFDRLTVSQSDERIRNFLCIDYSESRSGNTISLQISPFQSGAEFILRTHLENVKAVDGGSANELEQGAWLIHADEPEVKIELQLDEQYKIQDKE